MPSTGPRTKSAVESTSAVSPSFAMTVTDPKSGAGWPVRGSRRCPTRRPPTTRPRSELPEVDAEASFRRSVATVSERSRGCATAIVVSSPPVITWPPRSRTNAIDPVARRTSAARSSAQPLPHAPSSMPARLAWRVTVREESSKVKRRTLAASRELASSAAVGIRPPVRSPHAATRGLTAGSNAPPVVFSHSKIFFSSPKSSTETGVATPGAAAFSRARGVSSRHVERRRSAASTARTAASLAARARSRVGAETVRASAVPMAVRWRTTVSTCICD